MAPPSDPRKSLYLALRLYSTILAAAVEILLFFFGGLWADRKLGSSPWLTVAGAISGLALAVYHLYAAVRSSIRKE